MDMRQSSGQCLQAKGCQRSQKTTRSWERGRERSSLALQGGMILVITQLASVSLQNCEIIHFWSWLLCLWHCTLLQAEEFGGRRERGERRESEREKERTWLIVIISVAFLLATIIGNVFRNTWKCLHTRLGNAKKVHPVF